MANSLQETSQYQSATSLLQSLLYPVQTSKYSNNATTLAERIAAIPSATQALVKMNSQQPLSTFLTREIQHYTVVVATENEAVTIIANFIQAKPTDVRNKVVIPDTELSKQIEQVQELMTKMKQNLNHTAHELEKMEGTNGYFSYWMPDPGCSYFHRALQAYEAAQKQKAAENTTTIHVAQTAPAACASSSSETVSPAAAPATTEPPAASVSSSPEASASSAVAPATTEPPAASISSSPEASASSVVAPATTEPPVVTTFSSPEAASLAESQDTPAAAESSPEMTAQEALPSPTNRSPSPSPKGSMAPLDVQTDSSQELGTSMTFAEPPPAATQSAPTTPSARQELATPTETIVARSAPTSRKGSSAEREPPSSTAKASADAATSQSSNKSEGKKKPRQKQL